MAFSPSRRGFLETSLATALFGATGALPAAPPVPSRGGRADDEEFWAEVRRDQFYLPAWRGYLNNGSLGVCPRPVVRAVTDSVLGAARRERRGDYPRWGYEECVELRGRLGGFVGAPVENLALTHNATHAMYLVAGGLELRDGDVVLLTNQEHPTCNGTWGQEESRSSIRIERVELEPPYADTEEIVGLFTAAFDRHAPRIAVFSDVLTTTGNRLPVARICAEARQRGIRTVVDGAHCPGQVPLDLAALGCDAYCASPHKWLLSPAGTGFLFVSDEFLGELPWCANGGPWWDRKDDGAVRFMGLGTNNDCVLDGLAAALDWYEEMGAERIYGRQHALARSVLERAQELPGVDLATPDDDAQFYGMVSLGVKGLDLQAADRLMEEQGLWTTRVGDRYRVSCHVHVRPSDLVAFFDVLQRQIRAQGLG